MGLDYSYIIIIKEENRGKLFQYINKRGSLDGNCACINFEVDSFILKYLEGGYDWSPHYDRQEIAKWLNSDGSANIGCINVRERKLPNLKGELSISFTAVTSSMSHLFRDSVNIHKWFLDLSKEVDSIITYIDLESEGDRIIYFRGHEINIELKGEGHIDLGKKDFLNIMTEFSNRFRFFIEE
ncbi:hypothetical protein [Paenibacillus periandrae]|uniref:hypothetical protein n=1 Tax=Paenibacillus periandrae TaxID=1761741 RepID=UPI001F095AB8|nr:hypothetical protein [Paenibacillus periandrae]